MAISNWPETPETLDDCKYRFKSHIWYERVENIGDLCADLSICAGLKSVCADLTLVCASLKTPGADLSLVCAGLNLGHSSNR
jgi:hypothetical protein